MNRRSFLTSSAASAIAFASAVPAFAQWMPTRPINAIVPYEAGGGTDTIARAIAASMGEALPVPVVIVNRPGASGIVGATSVASATPDGSTVMITSGGSFVLNSVLKQLEVDPFEDFVTIAQIGDLTTSLMVPANSPFQSIEDLIAAAKAAPGSLRWSHTGRGSFHHVAGQGFLNAMGLTAVDVAFKGGSATRAAVIGSQVDFGMIGIQQLAGFTNELRPLVLVSDKRDMFSPEVPTFAELGLTVPLISSPIVIFAPKGTPEDVVSALQDAVATAAASESFKGLMVNGNNAPGYMPGAETRAKLLQMQEDARAIVASLN